MSEFSESLLSRSTKRGMVRMEDNDDDSGDSGMSAVSGVSGVLSAHTTGTDSTDVDITQEVSTEVSQDVSPEVSTDVSPSTLPLPLLTQTQEFLTSLLERKYATPLKPEEISDLFHKFYVKFHDKAVAYCAQTTAAPSKEQQMETFEEISARKKQRQLRDSQVAIYDTLAEDLVCDSVYDKLFVMSSTISSDKAHNSFLRDRIRVLNEIGVGMDNLELTVGEVTESEFRQLLKPAGDILLEMNNSHTPRLKLDKLVEAQRQIVDILTSLLSSSTNADSMLPALIYTLINERTPNLWANLMFIKRFRRPSALQGESLYCLTNFEAAITFLESVLPHEIGINLENVAPNIDTSSLVQPWHNSRRGLTSGSTTPRHNRRNNSIVEYVADSGIKVTLGGTLESSYKFLMGKFSQQSHPQAQAQVQPQPLHDEEHSSASSTHSGEATGRTRGNSASSSILRIGGRKRSQTTGSQHSYQSDQPTEETEAPTSLSGRLGGVIRSLRTTTPSSRSPNSGSPIREARGNSISSTSESEFIPRLLPHIAPPLEKVMKVGSSSELTLADVDAMFHDYRRLAQHLNEIGAFKGDTQATNE